jgi:hypothetical protein
MAREVNNTLAKILTEQRGIPETKAEEIVKGMRAANQYQVRPTPPAPLTGVEAEKLSLPPARTQILTSRRRMYGREDS